MLGTDHSTTTRSKKRLRQTTQLPQEVKNAWDRPLNYHKKKKTLGTDHSTTTRRKTSLGQTTQLPQEVKNAWDRPLNYNKK